MNKKQRLEKAVKQAEQDLKQGNYNFGMCFYLDLCGPYDLYKKYNVVNFLEYIVYKAMSLFTEHYWFNRNKEGLEKRIRLMKKALSKLE